MPEKRHSIRENAKLLILGLMLLPSTVASAQVKSDADSQHEKIQPDLSFNIDISKRISFEKENGELIKSIKKIYGDRISGIYFDYLNDAPLLVVRFTGTEHISSNIFANQSLLKNVKIEYNASHSLKYLIKVLNDRTRKFLRQVHGVQGLSVSDEDGSIHIDVYKNDQTDAQIRVIGEDVFGVPVVTRRLPVPITSEASGSGTITSGDNICTGGFIVKSAATGATGISSAAHCGSTDANYTGLDGVTSNLTFQSSVLNANADIAWYTTNMTNSPLFF